MSANEAFGPTHSQSTCPIMEDSHSILEVEGLCNTKVMLWCSTQETEGLRTREKIQEGVNPTLYTPPMTIQEGFNV